MLIRKARDILSLLRRDPDAPDSSAARARERQRRIALSAIAAAFAKGTSVLTALVSVPLTYKYLGEERYGLWITISSVFMMMAFADLGLGNGLVNRLAEAYGKDDRASASKYVSTAFFLLLGIAVVLSGFFFILYPKLNWETLFKLTSKEAISEAGPAVSVFAACFLIHLPFGVVRRIQMGFQEGFSNSLWSIGGNIIALIGIVWAVNVKAGLPWLVLAMAGGPLLATILNGIAVVIQRRWLMPSWHQFDLGAAKSLFKLGILFFILQVTFALTNVSDNVIIANVISNAAAVAEYALVLRLFMLAPSIMEMFIQPLWPAYGEAISRNDIPWIQTTLRRSLLYSVGCILLFSTFLVVFGETILTCWARSPIEPSFALLAGAAMWSVFSVAGSATAAFLNGTGAIRFQAITAVLTAVAAVSAKILFGERFGVAGVVWGTVTAYLVFTALPMSLFVPYLIRQASSRMAQSNAG